MPHDQKAMANLPSELEQSISSEGSPKLSLDESELHSRQLRQQNRRRKQPRRRLEPEPERPLIVLPPAPRRGLGMLADGSSNMSLSRAAALFSFALITDTHYWPTSAVPLPQNLNPHPHPKLKFNPESDPCHNPHPTPNTNTYPSPKLKPNENANPNRVPDHNLQDGSILDRPAKRGCPVRMGCRFETVF